MSVSYSTLQTPCTKLYTWWPVHGFVEKPIVGDLVGDKPSVGGLVGDFVENSLVMDKIC